MVKHFCEQVIAPGIVLSLKHQTDLSLSTWGVSVPYDYWRRNSPNDIVARFEKYSNGDYPQIPYLEFTNGEQWKFRFDQFPASIKPLCFLDDFLHIDSKAVPLTMWACSPRDGSRYYRELLMYLQMLARGASKDFTSEELFKECSGVKDLISHSRAIRAWQIENPDWREWKTIYEPGHHFHFNLF